MGTSESGRVGAAMGTGVDGHTDKAAGGSPRPGSGRRLPWVVVGGGVAGLAAAEALGRAGEPVLLLERRPSLGGRAGSFPDPVRGGLTDNLHLWMGCCTALRGLIARSGAADAVFEQPRVRVPFLKRADRPSPPVILEALGLPRPLDLLLPLLRFPLLAPAGRSALLRGLARMRRDAPELRRTGGDRLFGEWLDEAGQPPSVREAFWGPVVTSALNARLDEVRADLAAMTFTETFLTGRSAAALGWPIVPLAELWDRVAERIRDRGGEVRCGAKVTGVEIDESPRIRAIRLIRTSAAGTATEAIEVAGAVLAVPPGVLTGLLPAQWRAVEPFNRGTGLSWSPILNLHLWFDRPVTGEPMLAVTGSPLQWIFVRPPATGYSGRDQHLDLVISAACPWLGKTPETIRDALLPELQALLPAARDAGLIAWKVVLMHRATFAPRPGSERFRPPAAGPVPNLALAGAWTATGWPSTLEGAVRSGEMAARVLQLLRDRAPSVSPT